MIYYFSFTVSGSSSLRIVQDKMANDICPQTLVSSLHTGLSAKGFACREILGEEFRTLKSGTTYLIKSHVNTKPLPQMAMISVTHKRSLLDKFLGRNRLAPQNYIEKTLRDVIKSIPGVDGLQESQSFTGIGTNIGTFTEIRQ